ncbi:MAG: site-specific recombinase [Pseudomonadota bacterium]
MPQQLLRTLTERHTDDPVGTLVALIDWLRPRSDEDASAAIERIEQLQAALEADPSVQEALHDRLGDWLDQARFFQILAGLGLFSRRGFLRELGQRVYERLNPAPADPMSVRDVFYLAFHETDDPEWVAQVPPACWERLMRALWPSSPRETGLKGRDRLTRETLYAVEMLAIWIAAEEFEPDILRLDPSMATRDSSFIALQREVGAYVRDYAGWMDGKLEDFHDDAHIRVLLDQCSEEVERLHRRAVTRGTSISLTHLLERLGQTIARIERLLDILDPKACEQCNERATALFTELVEASSDRHGIRPLIRRSMRQLARSVTENASDKGEHYIAGDRPAYYRMLASGLAGGLVIAVMALIKIHILESGFARLPETVLVSLNYGLGFVLIHILHGTVATKQPAMTAASIAEQVEQGEHGRANPRKLAELLLRVGRTQFVAIAGNVIAALSLAFLIAWVWQQQAGASLITPERAKYILEGINPATGLALFYAAIAGVWLFLSGLIAGFFDNRAAYLGLEARLREHPLLKRLLPQDARHGLAAYLHDHYGALISNFAFGIMLGTTGYVGYLVGLPLDIRHVAFSSADLGYAMSQEFAGPLMFLLLLAFVLMIGAVNLMVSFTLALNVALRARGARIARPRNLVRAYWQLLTQRPSSLIYPPPAPTHNAPNNTDSAPTGHDERGDQSTRRH